MTTSQPTVAVPEKASGPLRDLGAEGDWAALADEAARGLAAGARLVEAARGEDVDTDIGILLSGIVGVHRDYSDGRHLYCSLFHRGDLFDLRREARRRQGRLRAVTDARVLCLDAAMLHETMRAHPELVDLLIHQLREQAGRLRDHCADLAFKTPLERLASVILEFRRWPDVTSDGNTPDRFVLTLPLSRADIAEYIGLKPETVSRGMQQLARERIIRKAGRSGLEILNLPALRVAANGGRPRRSTGTRPRGG